jgi:hypothetical protein
MIHSLFDAVTAPFSLAITRNNNASSNCSARIEALFIVFPASTLSLVRAVDRFSAVLSASAKSLP